MNENKMMEQVGAMFGVIMTFFYIGIGLYILFAAVFNDPTYKMLRVIVGPTFILYGIYRGFRTYAKIAEVFFPKNNEK